MELLGCELDKETCVPAWLEVEEVPKIEDEDVCELESVLLGDEGGGEIDDGTDTKAEVAEALTWKMELFDVIELGLNVEPVSVIVLLEDRDLGTVREPVRVLELLLAEMEKAVELKPPVSVDAEEAVDEITAEEVKTPDDVDIVDELLPKEVDEI